jgi:hypothetical protein
MYSHSLGTQFGFVDSEVPAKANGQLLLEIDKLIFAG